MSEAVLQHHLELCEETYSLMLEENKALKSPTTALNHDFIEKKKTLLAKLEDSVKALKGINEGPPTEGLRRQELIKAAQNKMMKVFLLERENEQLMLKRDFDTKASLKSTQPSKSAALKAYSDHSTPK